MNNIEKNLYEFYRIFESVKTNTLIFEEGFEVIDSANSWPRLIFNLNKDIAVETLIPSIVNAIETKNHPKYFIAPQKYISIAHSELLKSHTILPVKILIGMNINPQSKKNLAGSSNCEIKTLNNELQFEEFSKLIQHEFIASDLSFKKETLVKLTKCNEILLFGLFSGKAMVSALMVFTKEETAGLYFIVTKKEHQKKGYASLLINNVLNRLSKNGVKEVVLHGNNNSSGLYRKLGFIDQSKFIIYRKL